MTVRGKTNFFAILFIPAVMFSRVEAFAFSGVDPPNSLGFAISAMISPQETFDLCKDLQRYLSQQLNRGITLKHRASYREVNGLLATGGVDFAWLCTGGYLGARAAFEAVPLAVPLIDGRPLYRAYIIVNRDSPPAKFTDLKGKIFAFTDPLSQTGRIYPTYLVARQNATVDEYFKRTFYTRSHDQAIEAVVHGLADAASIDSHVYEMLAVRKPELIAQTRIIKKSQFFGAPPIVATAHTAAPLRRRIQKVFLKMDDDPAGRSILHRLRLDGFIATTSELYVEAERIRSIAKGVIGRH